MKRHQAVLIPGDGIGPEVTVAVKRLLGAADAPIEWIQRQAGIAALAYTAAARRHARAIAVLGEMGELGPDAEESHRQLGEQLGRYRVDHLIVMGDNPNSRAMATEARNRGITTEIAHDVDEATHLVDTVLRTRPLEYGEPGNPGDVVLVKASNAVGLWRVAEQLIEKGQ